MTSAQGLRHYFPGRMTAERDEGHDGDEYAQHCNLTPIGAPPLALAGEQWENFPRWAD
ncbi:hypothetical protein [Janthinobacterium sp. UMAB-56]|uniref:hypothetical protein n=1 Tax=Janthinobacterium sp. UMAB-56 TaxID=1365361 RepID=UPI001C59E345|nr:hypothetical protein [Janthinobacterium sp. UMAB-56]